jgi:hypothetical protein
MKKSFLLLMGLLLVITVAGCGGGGGGNNGGGGSKTFAKLDIAGAKVLMITENSNSYKLYKITADDSADSAAEVNFLDANGQAVSGISPSTLYNVDETYVIISTDKGKTYLVRKDTGEAKDISGAGSPSHTTSVTDGIRTIVQTDGSRNIYYINATSGQLMKVNPNSLKCSTVSSSGDDTVKFFRVDNAGDVIYSCVNSGNPYHLIGANGNHVADLTDYIDSSTGQNITVTPKNCFVGPNGYFYVIWYYNSPAQITKIVKVTVSNGTEDTELRTTASSGDDSLSLAVNCAIGSATELQAGGKVYYINGRYFTKVYDSADARSYGFLDDLMKAYFSTDISFVDNTDDKLFFFGKNGTFSVIASVNPASDTATRFLSTENFSVKSGVVLKVDGTVYVGGTNLGGTTFIGKVQDSSTITEIKTGLGEIKYIERLQ